MSEHDIQGISAIFLGLGIGVEFGKISGIKRGLFVFADKPIEQRI